MIVTLLTVALVVLLGVLAVVHLNCRELKADNARWQSCYTEAEKRHHAAAFRLSNEIADLERAVDDKDAAIKKAVESLSAAEAERKRLEQVVIERHCNCEDADAKHQATVAFLRDIAQRIGSHLTRATSTSEIPF